MDFKRRQFLTALAASTLLIPFAGMARAASSTQGSARYYSSRADYLGRYFISAFDEAGKILFNTPLPARGHALALHPVHNHLVAVARRPGTFMLVIDSRDGKVLHQLDSGMGRHFFGHSLFSADGRWLYTTENDIDNERGVIGVRDANAGYEKVGEFSSHGIGPHELGLLSDGRTLVVANGGILTLPQSGRDKLNLDEMSPSLAYIDIESGRLLEEVRLDASLHQNSIRHFAINADDRVCFAMQYEGDPLDQPPLVALHKRGEEVRLMQAPAAIQAQMKNYCGSVCADPAGLWFAVSSPKGNLITFWSAAGGSYLSNVEINDGCGIAPGKRSGEFLLSSGQGGVYRYRIAEGEPQLLHALDTSDARWDNHMTKVIS